MSNKIQLLHSLDSKEFELLESKWIKTLLSPQDDMWRHFRRNAELWLIKKETEIIGYFNWSEEYGLIQFYVIQQYLESGLDIFQELLRLKKIKKAIVGTNNPIFLTMANHFVKKISVYAYLFTLSDNEIKIEDKKGTFKQSTIEDLDRIIDFTHKSVGGNLTWIKNYNIQLVEKGEHFLLENIKEIIGICEVRRCKAHQGVANIGMIVSPQYRKKGYGTFLLHQAKLKAIEWNLEPHCSCDKDNVGSIKSIYNCGFITQYQLLQMEF